MGDYLVRGLASGGALRFFGAYTKDTVEFARTAHGLSPIATAALGRLLTGGAMMGAMMKNEQDLLTLKIDCDGPIGGLTVTANASGEVKGYVKNPSVDLPSRVPGKLNVGGALDLGVLSVIRDTGLKDPYVGQTILETGEIAEDLTYYFAVSEQTPSSVALGVLLNEDGSVRTSGGFIFQVMPGVSDAVVSALEKRLSGLSSVTEELESGKSIEALISGLLDGFEPEFTDRMPVAFVCGCSRGKTRSMIASLPKEELQSMIDDGKETEVICHFCSHKYLFSAEELKEILAEKS
ncbi:MAG: Hsp33 family molecular chaperone HslO [Lachnospiraceae bacterium]|nr:Hsp33 family molecular chaperone HslO [Lachnospiraceae bacterium]